MRSDQDSTCMLCGARLPAGITFREVRDANTGKYLGDRCWNKCARGRDRMIALTEAEVFERVFPAEPESVTHAGGGIYQAKWSPFGSPFLDTEVIKKTPGAKIVEDLRRADEPYGYMVLRFKLEEVAEEVNDQ